MDVNRVISSPSAEALSSQNSDAVAAIHQSMVSLRQELIKKNERIKLLEHQVKHKGSRKFEDIFELQIDPKEYDKILLYEDAMNQKDHTEEGEEKKVVRTSDAITEDPIMAFVLSEEEDAEEDNAKKESKTLVPKVEIEIHKPPEDSIRPILRGCSQQPSKSCTGSQTDITAIDDATTDRRPWSSEPFLVKTFPSVPKHISFKVPSLDWKASKMNFEGKSRDWVSIFQREIRKTYETHSPYEDKEIHLPKVESFQDESQELESLLFEADSFVRLSQKKLVNLSDWKFIQRSNVIPRGTSPFQNESSCFVPHTLQSLKIGDVIRFMNDTDNSIAKGNVTEFVGKSEVGVKSKFDELGSDWESIFKRSGIYDYLVTIDKIIECRRRH